MIGGGILQETGTLDDSDITTDTIRLEDGTDSQLVPFEIILEDGNLIQEDITPDSSTKVFTLTSLNANTDNIRIFRDNKLLNSTGDYYRRYCMECKWYNTYIYNCSPTAGTLML